MFSNIGLESNGTDTRSVENENEECASMNFRRQLGFYDPERDGIPRVTIIGAGGIGSFVAPALAQMGMTDIVLFDDDEVEMHNLPNQNFDVEHRGFPKVEAVRHTIYRRCGADINVFSQKFDERTRVNGGICIFATDSIDSRKMAFESFFNARGIKPNYVIDGRLGGEMYQVLTVDMNDEESIAKYRETLFAAEEAAEQVCTAKAIIYVAYAITADICRTAKCLAKGELHKTNDSILVDHVGGTVEYDDAFAFYQKGHQMV